MMFSKSLELSLRKIKKVKTNLLTLKANQQNCELNKTNNGTKS